MLIEIRTYPIEDQLGRVIHVESRACIWHSPREGFDHAKIAALEVELTQLVNKRLAEAIKLEGIEDRGVGVDPGEPGMTSAMNNGEGEK